ncbi:BspA family leucine-rich repeat surface protein [Allomuricauda sp. CP2A]|jgi:surface protein|uniref:BspA family leucine-rich repeat surface protein n=2 Tax=Allomuricauda sp. CP2A TaxID=1848189 RepID=UPI0008318D0C|nr:BspA family leucine-rich repeat surface protein [Muricauda sp. CP2A]
MKNLLYAIFVTCIVLSCSKDDGPKQSTNIAPVINTQTFTAHENITDGEIIGTVVATDADSEALTFSIQTNSNNLFELTPAGVLSLASGKKLDFASAQTHIIKVSVSDNTISSSAEIIINVTENQIPTIAAQTFEATEDIADTSIIGSIMANDLDGDALVFSISTNDNDLFEISESGELKLTSGQNLDFETAPEHNITVSVSDGSHSAEAQVTITVGNVIDTLAEESESFVTTWKTETDNETIAIGVNPFYSYNYKIEWGDGTIEEIATNSNPQHTYATAGTYTVAIQGDFPAIQMSNEPLHASKLVSVKQWGTIEWKSMGSAFKACNKMEYHATDVPDLSKVTNLSYMFWGASSFNGVIGNWNTENIIDMTAMFHYASSFNQDLNNWNVQKVQIMNSMFAHAVAFNGNISEWNVSNVVNMNSMFYRCLSFNQDIGGWNVGKVNNMAAMFEGAEVFNQNLNEWNVGTVTDMSNMFTGASAFNGDISAWNVGNVLNMSSMFHFAGSFDQDIGAWNVSKVQNMIFMFHSAHAFNQDISGWDVSQVGLMSSMFSSASSFNQNIGGWDVSSAIQMYEMFASATSFNQDISGWNVSNVTDMRYMFKYASSFDQNLGTWNIASSGHLYGIFNNSGLSTTNYDNILIGWAANPNTPENLTLGTNNVTYCNGANARGELINTKGWDIYDDGLDHNCN